MKSRPVFGRFAFVLVACVVLSAAGYCAWRTWSGLASKVLVNFLNAPTASVALGGGWG